jgi:hypothetical protein
MRESNARAGVQSVSLAVASNLENVCYSTHMDWNATYTDSVQLEVSVVTLPSPGLCRVSISLVSYTQEDPRASYVQHRSPCCSLGLP